MARVSRTDERQAALRFCFVALGWLGCLFAWLSLVSFSVADAPATSVWPHPDPSHNACGAIGAWLAFLAFKYFGVGAYVLLALLNSAVIAWSRGIQLRDLWLRCGGLALIVSATSAAGTLILSGSGWTLAGAGGVLGAAIAALLLAKVQMIGTILLLLLSLIVGLVLAADDLLLQLFRWLRWAGQHSAPVLSHGSSAVAGAGAAVAGAGIAVTNGAASLASRIANAPTVSADEQSPDDDTSEPEFEPANENNADVDGAEDKPGKDAEIEDEDPEDEEAEEPPARAIKTLSVKDVGRPARPRPAPTVAPRLSDDGDYELPETSLLDRAIAIDKGAIESLCREKAYILEQTLNEFRLAVEVVAIETGPVITVFELRLAPGIKVSQIASLSNDMARALKAPAVRVVAPLPGKNTIGIEVPNMDKEKVRLRELLETYGSKANRHAIPLYLGKDASGQPLVTDLTSMPHLLIAGTTGSGKSVCITSIITSILMTRSPEDVSLILIDPKVVELAMYKDVPHLMCPIVTEVPKAEGILEWASIKMDERYALLAEAGVKDIRSYNRLGYDGLQERLDASDEDMQKITVHLPFIVIVIDELADLMMTSGKEVEFFLCRIAQKSRAIGIHLIVSTQRPQANVVTGLIKSNLPSRIAFRVSSRLDSRIVLDQNGGEVLMGQGDMLFLPPGSAKLVRAQGTFVDDGELRTVVNHCKQQRGPQFTPELVRVPSSSGDGQTERDELFDQAVDTIVDSGRGSVSLLQRRLTVGYSRASRLIDQMYEAGLVGEYKGSQAREVMVSKDEWEAIKNQRDSEEALEDDDNPEPE